MQARPKLMVGLGNPGARYSNTRHNLGFLILENWARSYNAAWREKKAFNGALTSFSHTSGAIYLLCPTTYMNESGRSVAAVKDYYRIALSDILVVSDDAALPFGKLRLRPAGSSGGHNGLKSVDEALGTTQYARLRAGIGYPQEEGQALHDYVLAPFTEQQQAALPAFLNVAANALDIWASKPLDLAQTLINGPQPI